MISKFLKFSLTPYIFFALATGCQGPVEIPDPEESCGFNEVDGMRLSWKEELPITVFIEPSVPVTFYSAIRNAAYTWERGANRRLFEIFDSTQSDDRWARVRIYWLPNSHNTFVSKGGPPKSAETSLHQVEGYPISAEIKLNAQDYKFSNTPKATDVDAESILLHEFGHVLGLDHIAGQSSVMNESLAVGSYRRTLAPIDVSHIKCEY